jgi:Uma2 family endonuclease
MGVAAQRFTLEEFLGWEAIQPQRHEYWRGEVFAMVGGNRGHGRVVANLVRHLGNQLDGTPCQAFSEGMKVQVGRDAVLYPDVFVTCDRTFVAEQAAFDAPILIVEVLSPSTQAYDRSGKFAIYRRLASLREYVLIDPQTRRIDLFRLGDDGLWNLLDMTDEAELDLASVGCRIALVEVFKGMASGDDAAS